MGEVPAVITFAPPGPDGPAETGPVLVRHARLGLTWTVVAVLECWVHPYCFSATFPEPAVRRRYRLKVRGALPWQPGHRGEFIVTVRLYRDRRGWWMTPA